MDSFKDRVRDAARRIFLERQAAKWAAWREARMDISANDFTKGEWTASVPAYSWAVRCERGCSFSGWDTDQHKIARVLADTCPYDNTLLTQHTVPKDAGS